jgi:hypothetical protein
LHLGCQACREWSRQGQVQQNPVNPNSSSSSCALKWAVHRNSWISKGERQRENQSDCQPSWRRNALTCLCSCMKPGWVLDSTGHTRNRKEEVKDEKSGDCKEHLRQKNLLKSEHLPQHRSSPVSQVQQLRYQRNPWTENQIQV